MANLAFVRTLPSGDPDTRPITFVGKKKNLIKIPFDQNIAIHLGDKVSEDVSCCHDHGTLFVQCVTAACCLFRCGVLL